MKFGVVGVTAFIIDYALLALLTEVFGLHYLISATISFTVATIFNYLASMRYVFTHKEELSRRREFIIFFVLSAIGLVLNNICMWAGVELLGIHYLIVKIGAGIIVSIWNFTTRKVFLDAGRTAGGASPREDGQAPAAETTDDVSPASATGAAADAAAPDSPAPQVPDAPAAPDAAEPRE